MAAATDTAKLSALAKTDPGYAAALEFLDAVRAEAETRAGGLWHTKVVQRVADKMRTAAERDRALLNRYHETGLDVCRALKVTLPVVPQPSGHPDPEDTFKRVVARLVETGWLKPEQHGTKTFYGVAIP